MVRRSYFCYLIYKLYALAVSLSYSIMNLPFAASPCAAELICSPVFDTAISILIISSSTLPAAAVHALIHLQICLPSPPSFTISAVQLQRSTA
jgi:hypothetical protein